MPEPQPKVANEIWIDKVNGQERSGDPECPTTSTAGTAFTVEGRWNVSFINPPIICFIDHPDGKKYTPDNLTRTTGKKWTASFDNGLPSTGGMNASVMAHLLDENQTVLATAGPYFHKVT